ncbi:MAG: hypothetical protein U0Q18_26485 [Bryobacteraceae bacterium]
MTAVESPVYDFMQYLRPLPYKRCFYPFGLPVEIATDDRDVLEAAHASWGNHPARFARDPIRVNVLVSDCAGTLPSAPQFHGRQHLLTIISDAENFAICDRRQSFIFCRVTRATVADAVFFRWHFLDSAVYCLQELLYYTSLHAACVALDGMGVLLFGKSGAGKSSLSYACARRGWTYISDDASSLLWGDRNRTVIGDPHRFRFRESAPEIFPELSGLTVGRELDHKPTIEVSSADLSVRTSGECQAQRLVFLDRKPECPSRMSRISGAEARARIREDMVQWDPDVEMRREEAMESLLELPAFELRYAHFADAIPLLEGLVRRAMA